MTVKEFFDPRTRGSTWRVEALAGVTTFMTLAYIIVVNAGILSAAKMDQQEAVVATCLAAALGTLLMGFLADYPIALAPGMGLNAFFAFTICGQMGADWRTALAIVFVSGVLFLILTLAGIREGLMKAVPDCLKYGFACGIGIFIALIGLQKAEIVAKDPATMVTLGRLSADYGRPLVVLAGTVVTGALLARRVRGALLIGIALMCVYAAATGQVRISGVAAAPSLRQSFCAMDFHSLLAVKWILPVLILLFFDVFDTMGTLIGVGELGGFVKDGQLPRAKRALLADALATVGGAALGTSTVTSYIESAAGVAEGGRTGLANLFTAGLLILAAFLAPLITPFAAVGWVAAPALVAIGVFMLRTVRKIDMEDITEALPAFAAMLVMPFTFSISNGLVAGFVSYAAVKLLAGRARQVHPWVWVLCGLFAAGYLASFVLPSGNAG